MIGMKKKLPKLSSKPVCVWEVRIYLNYQDKDGWREKSITNYCVGESLYGVAKDAAKYGQLLAEKYSYLDIKHLFSCLKIGSLVIGKLGDDRHSLGIGDFEWKLDYPGTINDHIEAYTRR